MKKITFYHLFFLIIACVLFFVFIFVMSDLIATTIVFFKIHKIVFSWQEALYEACDRAYIPGIVAGIGLWIKAKLQERQEKKKNTKPDEQ